MASPLTKAKRDPESMKAKILASARKLFGEYGFHGTATRMVAKDVGIDISTLYYHWGEKSDLYEAVIMDLNEEIHVKLLEIEKQAKGQSMKIRFEIAINVLCDYLFANPEVSNLIIFRYFSKTKVPETFDHKLPEYVSNVAVAMGLAMDKEEVSVQVKAKLLTVWNSLLNFASGEHFFRPQLNISHEDYIQLTKETLNCVLVPAFTQASE
ncbi:TetR/AcrR family transcriptional regulator [Deltaproteobacteria bacterium TL4]